MSRRRSLSGATTRRKTLAELRGLVGTRAHAAWEMPWPVALADLAGGRGARARKP